MSVKIAGKLPKGDKDGLSALAEFVEQNPLATHIVVAVLVPSKRVADYDHPDDPVQYHFRLASIEPLMDKGETAARKLLEKAYSARVGMPLDFGEDE